MNPAANRPHGTALSVNVNKVALLRNTRSVGIPSVTGLAQIALEAGAHGITVHPRPDARHIRAQDVAELAQLLQAWPAAQFNIEGNPDHGVLAYIEAIRPTQCTLVPDAPDAPTSDHGWDLVRDGGKLREFIAQIKAWGVRVSVFMDPEPAAMAALAALGADRVELYTEPYAEAFVCGHHNEVLTRYRLAAQAAVAHGMQVNAGHDLNLDNLPAFLAAVPAVAEVSIGHALIADALRWGMAETVRRYLVACV
ncbi:MAG TPA: pyridoxine 5'-phosphate synthase [Burkholderiaceae bacterium]|nr:pyridoxine 5'-phosphate synthase [Burkholderiaceae bacterium]